jgi:chaperonin GroEL
MPRPAVLSSPIAAARLKQGFDTLAQLLSLTLGPSQGVVLSSTELAPRPEILSDAATIARRMAALPDPSQDVGAMLLRNMVWRVHEQVGDGGATTAVLAQAILSHATRYIQAGANPVLIQQGVRQAAHRAVERLKALAEPPQGELDFTGVAQAVTGYPELSRILGELYDLLGPHAYITIEDYMAPYLERVYVDGGQWKAKLISPYLVTSPGSGRSVLADASLAVFDGPLTTLEQVQPLLELALKQKPPHLLLAAHSISGEALTTLVATHTTHQELKIAGLAMDRVGDKLRSDLQDLALLTGAQLISPETGRQLQSIQSSDLGRARRSEASSEALFVVGGGGDPAVVRAQIERLQQRASRLPFDDEERQELEMRLGRLSGSAAILKIGALTKSERDVYHQKAEQGVKALRATLEEGVLPGGGASYLHCLAAIEPLTGRKDDTQLGATALARALEAPFRKILENAQVENPAVQLQQVIEAGPQYTFDAVRKQLTPARQGGILDPEKVLRVALETATSGAIMAISTDTVVLKRKPRISYQP